MLDWADDFFQQCFDCIPEGRYYKRLRSELEIHLTALTHDLSEAGYSQAEARAEALRQMGDPAELNRSYREAWLRQPEYRALVAGKMFWGCILAGFCYIVAFLALCMIGFTYDAMYPGRTNIPLLSGDPLPRIIFGAVLFLCAYLANAIYLRIVFRRHRNKYVLITTGLLMTWVCEKASILLLSSLVYGIPPFMLPELMYRIAYGGDQSAPWFQVPYIIWTFAGCFVLGWLFCFGRRDGGKHPSKNRPECEKKTA